MIFRPDILQSYIGQENVRLFNSIIQHAKTEIPELIEKCKMLMATPNLLFEQLHYMKNTVVYMIDPLDDLLKDFECVRKNHNNVQCIERILTKFQVLLNDLKDIPTV